MQIVDGVEAIQKAVREQVRFGADWIKVYADRGYSIGDDGRLRSRVNYTKAERFVMKGGAVHSRP